MSGIGNIVVPILSLLGAIVTAIATILLWRVTKVLAIETKRLADASAQPHVVATIEPNQWSMMHADISVTNTGNATAYDIEVEFDPPLENGAARSGKDIPLQRISVLKPGHSISSYLCEFQKIIDNKFEVSTRWSRTTATRDIEFNKYTLDLHHMNGISKLGASNPTIQIAEQVKKIREDWQWVASGSRKVKADIYSTNDRNHDDRVANRRLREHNRQIKASQIAETDKALPETEPQSAKPRRSRRK